MTSSIFITGTNTGIGKTITSALILSAAHRAKQEVNYFKPIQTGTESDNALMKELTGLSDLFIKNPVYSLKLPASPYQAALNEKRVINPTKILEQWQAISQFSTVVEGVGGLLVPISKNFLIRDLIKLLKLRLVIVANTFVGTLNHILLTIEAALSLDVPILGIILFNKNNNPWLIETIDEFTSIPILTEIPWLNCLKQQNIFNLSSDLFNQNILELFFGKK